MILDGLSRLMSESAHLPAIALGFFGMSFGILALFNTQHLSPSTSMMFMNDTTPNTTSTSTIEIPTIVQMHADISNCTLKWMTQKIDHFAWLGIDDTETSQGLPAVYKERYFINTQWWNATNPKAPIFFYTGNEADVSLYVNHTGLIWENAHTYQALIVFAEHRYYGESLPFGPGEIKDNKKLAYLTHEQALADYIVLIKSIQDEYNATGHPVIAFGGSYGGMLSAWLRMKYPSIVHGAIAASAPILGFPAFSSWKSTTYWHVVTQDASPQAGSSANCVPNVKKSWDKIFALAKSDHGRTELQEIFRLCTPLEGEDDGEKVAMAVLFAFDNMAMGNFPYSSSYLTGGTAELPAWPVREACSHLDGEFDDENALLSALRDAAMVYHNASKLLKCFTLPTLEDMDGIWDYQWCTQMLPQETYFTTNGVTDMFWPRSISQHEITRRCQKIWKVTPDPDWIRMSYGDELLRGASNIVFSNGKYDPWSSGGVHESFQNLKLTIIPIQDGAHHVDLFFSHPNDTESIQNARKQELEQITLWINQYVRENLIMNS